MKLYHEDDIIGRLRDIILHPKTKPTPNCEMNVVHESLVRQMLIIQKLKRAGIPVLADDIFSYLEDKKWSYGYSYPEERKSRMRLLQRDINGIDSTFKLRIIRVHKSHYEITSREADWIVDYDRLFADFDLLTAIHPDAEINRHIIPERSRNPGSEHLFDVLRAIKERCMIEFDYVNYRNGGSMRHHMLAPHFLKEDQGLWYVVGYENGKVLLFALDRIKNLMLTDEEFKFDDSLDIEENFRDSYGIWADPSMPTEEIELRYDALDGNFLKARPLHPSQTIVADTTEEFRITLRLKITNDFVMALLSRARSLEVIRPLHLRERIRATLADALARNS